jgi:hypothetical protein
MYAEYMKELLAKVYDLDFSLYHDYSKYLPFYCLVGFSEEEPFKNESFDEIWNWMGNNAKPLFGICIINKLSWLDVCTEKGALHMVNENNEETKAFVAILLDNIRTRSQQRYLLLSQKGHTDWLGIYTRDQTGIKEFFDKVETKKNAQEKRG